LILLSQIQSQHHIHQHKSSRYLLNDLVDNSSILLQLRLKELMSYNRVDRIQYTPNVQDDGPSQVGRNQHKCLE